MAVVSRVEYDILFDVHIEFLYNDFLLYRTLGKRTQTQPEAIVGIAREILKALIIMISEKVRSGHPIKDTGFNVSGACLGLWAKSRKSEISNGR